ncbi:angiopoietin-4-like [Bacillus rossius redtenbacheri]|uniref:angiopoietin-4-like n=1 Tax=Bacillus rossius redtenbacheri TaxID=93214 RepID=UPI002FDD4CE7
MDGIQGLVAGALLLASVGSSLQVPPSSSEKIWEELTNVKIMMSTISEELQKFNTLYLNKLEYRMVSTATVLASLDSNVRNLQERAHVWDTFQLHVAAWNDQISSLDSKIDILSRGQEKMAALEGKVGSLAGLEYKVERAAERLGEAADRLAAVGRGLEDRGAAPLLGEFAGRGALSTLRLLERKVDRLLAAPRAAGAEGDHDQQGRLVIRCNTPVLVEDLLKDVSAKVDVIFDQTVKEEGDPELQRTSSAELAEELSLPPGSALLDKLWKRLTNPCKKSTRALEAARQALDALGNWTAAALDEQAGALERVSGSCLASGRRLGDTELLLKRTEAALQDLVRRDDRRLQEMSGLLEQQKELLRSAQCPRVATPRPRLDEGSGDYEFLPGREDAEDGDVAEVAGGEAARAASCEELSAAAPAPAAGVFALGGARELNERARDFNTRYCETSAAGGGWTVILRRGQFAGPRQNFTLPWDDYRAGFGDLDREFWFGNDFIHRLTAAQSSVLRVELEAFDGRSAWAEYSYFRVDNEERGYRLTVGGYAGNATDSLAEHNSKPFSTVDRKNDEAPPCCPCAPAFGGGWWFSGCFEANLNGVYYSPEEEVRRDQFRGIIWERWLGDESLRAARMMVRARGYSPRGEDEVRPLDVPEDP